MNYISFEVTIEPYKEEFAQIVTALLSELPFESFEDTDHGIKAYCQEVDFDATIAKESLNDLNLDGASLTFTSKVIPKVNWNEEWEKNFFDPILIDDQCLIRSTFHKNTPSVKYEVVIDPKMSFGTGHHSTTSLMVKQLLNMDINEKSILDMGCGTGILAILARMRGANPVMAIDIDEWSVENTQENTILNNTSDIAVKLGGAETIKDSTFDVILANINRNILLQDMKVYVKALKHNGTLIMSGFYENDLPLIEQEANKNNLKRASFEVLKDWTAAVFIRK